MDVIPVTELRVSAYRIPTEEPESDGTLEWHATTLVLVELEAGGKRGIGYTYADASTATLILSKLKEIVIGRNVLDVPAAHLEMLKAIRNLGRAGIASTAIAAVDVALWDLKGKLLNVALLDLLGATRSAAAVYASGGFTSYSDDQLQRQMSTWAEQGFRNAKMKIGRSPDDDRRRVHLASKALGSGAELYVDANGAYASKAALAQADAFARDGVTWFEEPVSSDDLEGLSLLRQRFPAGMRVAAGEYGYDEFYFRRMLEAGAVDVLQADATRCGGVTGFLRAAALAEAHQIPFSFHCAPALHSALACAVPSFVIGEYFVDHVLIEDQLFDGAPRPSAGMLTPNLDRPGLGLDFKHADAARYLL